MSLPIFCPAQTRQPLDQSPARWRQTQWISKRWPPGKIVAQKRSVCWVAHPLNWLSARQALNAWLEIFPQAIFAQFFPSNSEKTFLIISTMSLTPGGSPSIRIISSRFVWGGLSSDVTVWACGCLACQRGKIHRHTHLVPSLSCNSVFLIYMLIWWAQCSTVIVLIIFLPFLIACPSGWKPSLFQKRLQRHAQKL
jgi:hypothetical protein